ncbi:hypothetical protein CBI33_24455 [Rhodococcus erythropolis]|nr:hypothetical protein CBI33_24455 [Rhodococcus erythropolis]
MVYTRPSRDHRDRTPNDVPSEPIAGRGVSTESAFRQLPCAASSPPNRQFGTNSVLEVTATQ